MSNKTFIIHIHGEFQCEQHSENMLLFSVNLLLFYVSLGRFSVSILMFSENVLLLSPLNGQISCSKLSRYRIAVTQSLNSDLRFVCRLKITLFVVPTPSSTFTVEGLQFQVITGFQTKQTICDTLVTLCPNLPQKPVLRSVKALLCTSQ